MMFFLGKCPWYINITNMTHTSDMGFTLIYVFLFLIEEYINALESDICVISALSGQLINLIKRQY